ncbi:MAG: DUF2000 domain-containing protein [Acidimicrobiia bacterium]
MSDIKSVLILNGKIPEVGVIANTAFVLGLTVGRLIPDTTFGPNVLDGDGRTHLSLTQIGHTVRVANPTKLARLAETLKGEAGLTVVDYTEDAAPADYAQYTATLGVRQGEDIVYRAVHVFGPADLVDKYTRNLSRA